MVFEQNPGTYNRKKKMGLLCCIHAQILVLLYHKRVFMHGFLYYIILLYVCVCVLCMYVCTYCMCVYVRMYVWYFFLY
jgi:hypothetical protein